MSDAKIFGMEAERGRWIFVLVGLLINLCLGAVYAFSVFKVPLQEKLNIGATQSGLPFMIFLAVFALAMALAGGLAGKWGPKRTSILGGVLVGTGWILAGLAPNIWVLTLFYGVIGGGGVGIMYGCPIAVAAKWFPDKKGLAVGLTVMGFGLSALITAPIIGELIETITVLPTFMVLGAVFLVLLVVLAIPLRFPPEGWLPQGWTPVERGRSSMVELDRSRMVRTSTFYALWGTYTIGCLAGLMAIGISKPVGLEVAKLAPGLATLSVSIFAVFNGVGRPIFGWLTDRLSPRYTAVLSFALILLASAVLYLWGQGNIALYFIAFSILWLNLGGWLAIAPTATATFFGTKFYGKNYGLVFTSYGVGAILGSVLSGVIRDATASYLPVFLPVMGLAALGLVIAAAALKPVKAQVPGS